MIWRWKTEAFEILHHSRSYLAGRCLESAVSFNPFAQQSALPLAKVILVGRRFIDLQTQYKNTTKAYQILTETFVFQRTYDIGVSPTGGTMTDSVFGITTNRWLRIQGIRIRYTVIAILRSLAKLFMEMFELSQHCVLVVETLHWDAESVKQDSLRKFFINTQVISDHLEELATSQNKALEQLEAFEPFFSKRLNIDLTPVIESLKFSPARAREISSTHDDLVEIAKLSAEIAGSVVIEGLAKPLCNMGSQLVIGAPVFVDPLEFCPLPSYEAGELKPEMMRQKKLKEALF